MKATGRLLSRYTTQLAPGRVEWIGVRPKRREAVCALESVEALEGLGLTGDHRIGKTPGSARQLTIISTEFIAQIAHFMAKECIDPALLRRNIVISGMNLNVVRHQRLQIGEAIIETTAWCHPCSRMEEVLGSGAIAAMMGHGGLCAKIVNSGRIQLGDSVTLLPV
ncbi:MOSC domain-containing protein [Teredinibacter sp. KSP-S5-2]|uniref:MOSC domain-containing protein n=1 Tax=Teredinibacter sp. KSP-S5-2 TaxID=3034506 RepID=UPI00293467C4|nr:MOSC domain-containing protein [Teredinibacter sp. KSP-S5-2]WNO10019.1 MOSC domain-containing protein [Teredinibacter sp. KSP-S5-2]